MEHSSYVPTLLCMFVHWSNPVEGASAERETEEKSPWRQEYDVHIAFELIR